MDLSNQNRWRIPIRRRMNLLEMVLFPRPREVHRTDRKETSGLADVDHLAGADSRVNWELVRELVRSSSIVVELLMQHIRLFTSVLSHIAPLFTFSPHGPPAERKRFLSGSATSLMYYSKLTLITLASVLKSSHRCVLQLRVKDQSPA